MYRKLFLLIAVFVIVSGAALAKIDPYVEDPEAEWGTLDAPLEMYDANAAVQMFGRLDPYGDVDVFAYDFTESTTDWPLGLEVPECGDHFTMFQPLAALVGPGLDTTSLALPFELPEGMGAVVFQSGQQSIPALKLTESDIPDEGRYYVAVWEPNGHVGAYILTTGSQHDVFAPRPDGEMEAAFGLIDGGEWMHQDCDAPIASESCPPTEGDTLGNAPIDRETVPLRAKVGEGYVLSGEVRDATTCLPIPEARITLWWTNETGSYDDDHQANILTNGQGTFRFESNLPGQYENVVRHYHLYITAPGYESIITEHLIHDATETTGALAIVLSAVE